MSRSPVAFGRYVITRRIARGGMAEIYRARTRNLPDHTPAENRWVALKMMRPALGHEDLRETLFKREARIAAALIHSNVIPLIEFGKEQDRYFIAMEYMRGRDLSHLIRYEDTAERDLIPVELGLYIGYLAANGLGFAHQVTEDGKRLEIVHRDVSPGNIMVGYDGAVKVLDFGVARIHESHGGVTQAGTLRGKFAYMSPEQTLGMAIDARSDVFSLGTLLYELLTGTNPFRARTPLATLDRVQRVRPVPPSRSNRRVPKEVDEILARCMAKDPRRRFADAAELGLALEEYLKKRELLDRARLQRFMAERFAWEQQEEEKELKEEEEEAALLEVVDFALRLDDTGLDAPNVAVSLEEEASQADVAGVRFDAEQADRSGVFFEEKEDGAPSVPPPSERRTQAGAIDPAAQRTMRMQVDPKRSSAPPAPRVSLPPTPPSVPMPAPSPSGAMAALGSPAGLGPAITADQPGLAALIAAPQQHGRQVEAASLFEISDRVPAAQLMAAGGRSQTGVEFEPNLGDLASGDRRRPSVLRVPGLDDTAAEARARRIRWGAIGASAAVAITVGALVARPGEPREAKARTPERPVKLPTMIEPVTISVSATHPDAGTPAREAEPAAKGLLSATRAGAEGAAPAPAPAAPLPEGDAEESPKNAPKRDKPAPKATPPKAERDRDRDRDREREKEHEKDREREKERARLQKAHEKEKEKGPERPSPAEHAASASGPGFLNVGAKPWAEIEIDGKAWPYQTPQAGIELPPGKHTITLKNREAGTTRSTVVQIKSGTTKTVTMDMRP